MSLIVFTIEDLRRSQAPRNDSFFRMDYRQFQQVFPAESHLPYDRKTQQDVDARRKKLDGVLFIDRVLRALGISKGKSLKEGLLAQKLTYLQ